MAIERVHYFDHQFLVVDDFQDEQDYQRDMRQRLTRGLHTFGIAEGLTVVKTGNRQVTVQPGLAFDRDGKQIVVEASHPGRVLDLASGPFPAGSTVQITATHADKPVAPTDTRVTEEPRLEARITPAPTDGTVVRLAQFNLAPDIPGAMGAALDGGVRQPAGARLGPASVDESHLATALQNKVNAPLVSLNGVSSPGANINLLVAPGSGLTVSPDNATKNITLGQNITPAQIGALALSGYDFQRRTLVSQAFLPADLTGTVRTLTVGFRARIVFAFTTWSVFLGGAGGRTYGGTSVGMFEALGPSQVCSGFGLTRLSNTDWFLRPAAPTLSGAMTGLAHASVHDGSVSPIQSEELVISVSNVSPTTLELRFERIPRAVAALANFEILVSCLCVGP
jgi:hypothetical protein